MGAACILYNVLVVGEEVEILLYCVIVGEGVVESVLYNAFCSDSASIFSNLCAWLRRNVEQRVTVHIHMLLTCRIYLNHDSDCDRFACQFLVWSRFGRGIVSMCYITSVGGLEKCYIVLHRLGGWSKNTIFALYNMWTAPWCLWCSGSLIIVVNIEAKAPLPHDAEQGLCNGRALSVRPSVCPVNRQRQR